MLYTSSEAAKLLKKLNEEKIAIETLENQSSVFKAAVGEDIESVRPDYNYSETQDKILELEFKIRKVKHAINIFNVKQIIPEFDMTIDEMLVYIPQLTRKKAKLLSMQSRLPKKREYSGSSNIIDYSYANYDIQKVNEDYTKISDELSRAQTALDVVNNQEKFEINI